jgi:hypothetical protein
MAIERMATGHTLGRMFGHTFGRMAIGHTSRLDVRPYVRPYGDWPYVRPYGHWPYFGCMAIGHTFGRMAICRMAFGCMAIGRMDVWPI